MKYFYIIFCPLFLVTSACQHNKPALRFTNQQRPAANIHKEQRVLALEDQRTLLQIQSDIAQSAALGVGETHVSVTGKKFRQDCSGIVRAIYAKAGVTLFGEQQTNENDTEILWRFFEQNGSIFQQGPTLGDVVFFHNTYDKNRDKKMNDELTHVGVVENILPDGTVIFVHYMGASIVRSRMNLEKPHLQLNQKTNERLNTLLRKSSSRRAGLTAAELFAGFGRLNFR